MRRALLVVLLVTVAGCGASEEDDARAVVESYIVAVADRDAQTVCAVMSPVQRQSVNCEQGMRDAWAEEQEAFTPEQERQFRATEITKVLLGDDRASVYTNLTEDPFELILIGDEWFLDPSAMA